MNQNYENENENVIVKIIYSKENEQFNIGKASQIYYNSKKTIIIHLFILDYNYCIINDIKLALNCSAIRKRIIDIGTKVDKYMYFSYSDILEMKYFHLVN